MTPSRCGINGNVDRRLQRYIAARLGPLPGWTMGYGFDLDEWVTVSQLAAWRDFAQGAGVENAIPIGLGDRRRGRAFVIVAD